MNWERRVYCRKTMYTVVMHWHWRLCGSGVTLQFRYRLFPQWERGLVLSIIPLSPSRRRRRWRKGKKLVIGDGERNRREKELSFDLTNTRNLVERGHDKVRDSERERGLKEKFSFSLSLYFQRDEKEWFCVGGKRIYWDGDEEEEVPGPQHFGLREYPPKSKLMVDDLHFCVNTYLQKLFSI